MKLTKQHFQLIADTIAALPEKTTQDDVAMLFALKLQETNPLFNIELFVKACKR